MAVILRYFTKFGSLPNATKFGKITQNNGHYGVQGHSRFHVHFRYQLKARKRLRISE